MNSLFPFLIFIIQISQSLSLLTPYQNCPNHFTCGSITGIRYPFRGYMEPDYCSYPGLELHCNPNKNITTIHISNTTYRVLSIDQISQTMSIAREDVMESTCPREMINTTLDNHIFNYASSYVNITFLYGCPDFPNLPIIQSKLISCGVSGAYAFADPVLGMSSLKICKENVVVPVLQTELIRLLSLEGLGSVLKQGFVVKWVMDMEGCMECTNSGGRCGYDFGAKRTACFCPNPPYRSSTCSETVGDPTHSSLLPDVAFSRSQVKQSQPAFFCLFSTTILQIFDMLFTIITQCPSHSSHKMNPIFAAGLLLLLFSGNILPASSQHVTLPNCNTTFSCGSITNITYPFTGADRPNYCGHPNFRLTCRDNNTELTAGELTYRVLKINQTQQTLILARLDLWNNTCPQELVNSTLDTSIFSSRFGNLDLTLIYGCNSSAMSIRPHNQFNCSLRDSNFTDAYYLVGPVPTDPILRIIQCQVSVAVHLLSPVGNRLMDNRTTLGDALTHGFMVNYSDPFSSQCSDCTAFRGQCGFDSNKSQPICICADKVCFPPASNGSNAERTSDSNSDRKIVLPIVGAILAGIVIGWLIFFCRQRRKRLASRAQTVSRAIPTLSSSTKGLISSIPSSKFAPTSFPSNHTSISDLEQSNTYFGVQVFTYAELEEATDKFNSSRELGDGGFGTVYYGKLIDGREVAIKRLYENNFRRVDQFINEVEILTRLHHQYLVKLYGCTSKHSRELLLVYEYIPNGTVADHLHGKVAKPGLLPWPVRLNIAIESAEALAFLHQSDIIHRDVKTANILLDNKFCVKVADFGLSRLFPNDATHVSTAPQGTPGYVDPEYYQCYQLTDKSDVYSFGVVLIELISSLQAVDTNRHRHDINLSNMAVDKIQNQMLNELVDPNLGFESDVAVRRMTTLVAELAFRCLQQDKDVRPSMREVLDTLREIKSKELSAQKCEVVDIKIDNEVLVKDDKASLPSPDSVVSPKWISGSTHDSSV